MKKISLTLDEEMYKKINKLRGELIKKTGESISMSEMIRRLLEKALKKKKYVVKWRRVDEEEWHDFNPPKIFDSFEEASDFVTEESANDNGMYQYKITEIEV